MDETKIDDLLKSSVVTVMRCKKLNCDAQDDEVSPRLYLLLQSPPSLPTPNVAINTRDFTNKDLGNQNQYLEGAAKAFRRKTSEQAITM